MIIVKILIAIIVTALAVLIQNVINLKKPRRARQFLIPFIAAIYGIIAAIIGYNNLDSVSQLFDEEHFLYFTDILIINITIVIGFIIVKSVLCPLLARLCKNKKFLEATTVSFYQYDDQYDEWFLLHKWVNFRKFAFAIVVGLTIVIGGFLGIMWAVGSSSPIWNTAFPCIALVIVSEIYNFINGQTKEEFEHNILGEDADSRKISNFYKVREVLEQILPEPLLASHTGVEYAGNQTPLDLINELKESDSKIDNITAEYFSIDDRYKNTDIDCVQVTLQMMHRNNVVIFNPFYRDSSTYITLPLVNSLLAGKKCVVISGRMSNCKDIKNWLTEILAKYSHMKTLWDVKILSEKDPDCDVGILSFPQLYDKRIISANRPFFNETDFVMLIEPSLIVNTGQVALSIIAQEIHCNDEKPVYCICDRNTEGLVDTLSHLLHAEITNVVAPPVPRCIYTGMAWDADGDFIRQQIFDKQTKYLGNGVELAAIAVKNQIPNVSWYCETKAPIKDIKWIAGQQHSTICRYMNQPAQQKSLYEKIKFIPHLWSMPKQREEFIIAEDEFCNMFATMRAYLSRGISQSFVNVMSENYLLRDYMRCNKQMFLSNPNAVPSIVPDYAKTERNTLIKLILLMTYRPVTEAEIIDEFHLVGIETSDAFDILTKMLKKYTFADNSIFTMQSVKSEIDELTTVSTCQYIISNEAFEEFFAESLKNAYFILEDEKHEIGYIDAKLFGHVTQTILPGQFVTYDGKYYVAKHVSPQSGVVLRRASDLYDGRKYYRQIREYKFESHENDILINHKTIMDIEVSFIQKDFSVTTTGYLEMNDNHNLRTARKIDFSKDPSVENYQRKYHNKTVMRIKLPDTNDKIRFTICLLLSEIFKTVFPDGYQYLATVTKRPDDIDGILNYVVYPIIGELEEDDDYIYIIEDSELDLGLLEAVERNWMKLMEIVADFLDWHYDKMREPEQADPTPISINYSAEKEKQKKQSLFSRMAQRIAKIFGSKKEEEVKIEEKSPVIKEEKIDNGEVTEETVVADNVDFELDNEENKVLVIDTDVSSNDEFNLESDTNEVDPSIVNLTISLKDKFESEYNWNEIEDKMLEEGKELAEIMEEYDRLYQEFLLKHNEEQGEKDISKTSSKFSDSDFIPGVEEDPALSHVDGTDIFDNEGLPEYDDFLENEFERIGITPLTKTRYQRECFLKFGFDEIDGRLQVDDVRKYLRVRGWTNNSLTKARNRDILAKTELDLQAVNHCDFCSLPLTGVSYEMLNDGRIRCNDCSSSAISTVEEFKTLFYQVLEMMESFYGVKYRVPIRVEMADARKVAQGAGCIFKPSTEVVGRVLGFAQRKKGKYSLLIENGSPRLAAIDTMVHELTHIWQYLNWDDSQIISIYRMGKDACTAIARDIVYEGMAMWSSIQYLYQIGETYYAAKQEALAMSRQDVYGIGFRLYCEQYPLIKDSSLIKYSPFTSFPTLEPQKVMEAIKSVCGDSECSC